MQGDGQESAFHPQTHLVEISGQIFCQNSRITEFPGFYVSTMVSALLHNNSM